MAAAQIPVHAPETIDSDGLFLFIPGLQLRVSKRTADALHMS